MSWSGTKEKLISIKCKRKIESTEAWNYVEKANELRENIKKVRKASEEIWFIALSWNDWSFTLKNINKLQKNSKLNEKCFLNWQFGW